MDNMLLISNDGKDIEYTNYWQTDMARHNAFYLSTNAGGVRLLVPPKYVQGIEAIKAREVIISRGPWPKVKKSDAFEILFEEDTETPYVILLGADQVCLLPSKEDDGRRDFVFTAWKPGKGFDGPIKMMELPCSYRIVPHLPWGKTWGPKWNTTPPRKKQWRF